MSRLSLLVLGASACATYDGPVLEGRSTGRAANPQDIEIHLVWQVEEAADFVGSTKTDLTGDVLGEWTAIPRNDPPRVATYNVSRYLDVDGPQTPQDFALAYIEAVVPGTVFDTVVGFDGRNIRGIDETHLVAWVPQAIEADSPLGQLVRGPMEPGYHILDVVQMPVEERMACSEAHQAQWDACDDVDLQQYDTCIYAIDPSWMCYPSQLSVAPDDLDTELAIRMANVEDITFPSWP